MAAGKFLDVINEVGRCVAPCGDWTGVIAALEAAPDGVYEIRAGNGSLAGSATADGRGGWHLWGHAAADPERANKQERPR